MNKETTKYNKSINGGDSVKSEDNIITKAINKKVSRRTFIKTAAVAGGVAAATGAINFASATVYTEETPVGTAGVQYKRTTCFGCNGSCGVQVKVVDGVAVKIDGNPYDRQVADVTYDGPNAATGDVTNVETQVGRICAKGQAGIKSAYAPERIFQPLRRVGARGSGQWEAVSWSTAIAEIVAGSSALGTPGFHNLVKTDAIDRDDLHADFRQSTDYTVAGDRLSAFGPKSRQIVYTDGRNHLHGHGRFWGNLLGTARVDHSSVCNGSWKTAGKLTYGEYVTKSDIERTNYLLAFGTNPLGEANVPNTFQSRKLAAKLRDPNFTLATVDVRKTTTASKSDRWHAVKSGGDGALALGMIKHIIEGGLLDGAAPIDKKSNGANFTNDCKKYLRCPNQTVASAQTTADLTAGFRNFSDASWLINTVTGKYAVSSEFAAPTTAAIVALANEIKADYNAHIVLTDDLVHGAADAVNAVASGDATDLATAITLLNEIKADYNAHRVLTAGSVHGAADAVNAVASANATNLATAITLVNEIKADYNAHRVLTADSVHGAADAVNAVSSPSTSSNMVLIGGSPALVTVAAVLADLDASGDNDSAQTCKTVFKALKDLAAATSWATVHTKTGIGANEAATKTAIEAEAVAFWNASNPSIMQYRGASQTSNGTYNALLIHALTTLRNRWDVAGGQHLVNWGWGTASAGAGGSNAPATGVNWDRANKKYSDVKGANSPATASLSWHKSAAAGAQQEVIAGLAAGYPFKASAYIMYAHNPVYTHPGANAYAGVLKDTDILPLFVSIDLFINETNQYADFVLPDTSWMERWGFGRNPNYGGPVGRRSGIRRPVIGQSKAITIDGHSTYINVGPNSSVTGDTFANYAAFLSAASGPLDVEDIFAAIGNVMKAQAGATAGASAYGVNGMGTGKHLYTTYDLHNQLWKWDGVVQLVGDGKRDLQSNGSENELADDVAAADAVAATTNGADGSVTGLSDGAKAIFMGLRANTDQWEADNIYSKRRKGYTLKLMPDDYAEVSNGRGYTVKQVPKLDDAVLLSNGNATGDSSVTYPFTLSQWKEAWHTQARSTNNEWLLELRPENTLDINPTDATTVGVVTGDTVKLTSATNSAGVTAKVRVTSTVRQGVVGASHHFGRTQQGAATVKISGGQGNIAGNPEIGKGVTLTSVTRNENGFTITDQYGGATLFYGSQVKIEKV